MGRDRLSTHAKHSSHAARASHSRRWGLRLFPGHLNVWGMGWAWMCIWHPQHPPTPHPSPHPPPPHPRPPVPPAPGLRAAATCLPPALPLLGQLAQPQCTRPGGGPLSPSLRGHASPGAPGTRRPAACLPASRRPGPHPTPHYPTPPLTAPQVSAMPPPVRTGSLPRTSAHCPRSCRSLSQSRLSGHPSTLRPSSLRHPLLMSSSGKAGQGETTLRGSERAPLRPRPRWSGGRGVAERWRP